MDIAGHRDIKVNTGAASAALAAYALEGEPAYAELVGLVGETAAKHIAITAAGYCWNARRAGSASSDQARRGITGVIEASIGPDAEPGTVARLAKGFHAWFVACE